MYIIINDEFNDFIITDRYVGESQTIASKGQATWTIYINNHPGYTPISFICEGTQAVSILPRYISFDSSAMYISVALTNTDTISHSVYPAIRVFFIKNLA